MKFKNSAGLLFSAGLAVSAAQAQNLAVLHSFANVSVTGTNQDGANPITGLTVVGNSFCGSTANGGRYGVGALFSLNTNGAGFAVIRALTNSTDAQNPAGDFAAVGNGFFGTSFGGGAQGTGAIFVSQTNGAGNLVQSFALFNADTATNVAGACPAGSFVLSGTTVYGAATAGGSSANGTLFAAATNGSSLTSLHDFSALDCTAGTNVDGATPWGGLLLVGNTLYGTTSAGGAGGAGTVFSINTSGSGFTTIYSFPAMDPLTRTNTDGAIPYGGLVFSGGSLYGVTMVGGTGGNGTIFSLGTNNGSSLKVLHHFPASDPVTGTNADGAKPFATLELSGGILYGTAAAGGTSANGTVFSVATNGANFTMLYSFTALDPVKATNSDGAFPVGDLFKSGNSLYGTANSGGPGGAGTVFSLSLPFPAFITSIIRNGDGSLTISFLGSPNSTNVVQTSGSLAPASWQNVSTNVADSSGVWQFIDTIAQNSIRFYRSHAP
jgi:uncharacterized repeat protein (TIGR03803 family)